MELAANRANGPSITMIKWAREHKEKTTDGRRVVGYATLPGGKIVVVMTSDTLEALQLHPNRRDCR